MTELVTPVILLPEKNFSVGDRNDCSCCDLANLSVIFHPPQLLIPFFSPVCTCYCYLCAIADETVLEEMPNWVLLLGSKAFHDNGSSVQ